MKLSIATIISLSLCSSVALVGPTPPPTHIGGVFKRQVGLDQITQLGAQIAQARAQLSDLINIVDNNAKPILDGISGDAASSLNNGLNQANQGVEEAVRGLASMENTIQSAGQTFQGVEGDVSGIFN